MSYQAMKVTDGNNATIKSDKTTSVDVHIGEENQHVNVILPNKQIIRIEVGSITHFDHDETALETILI